MNGATCTGSSRSNVYAVAYDAATGQFSFSRSTANRPFRIRWDRTPNNIRNALAETSTATPGWSTGTVSTDAPWTLLYRTTGTGTSGAGLNTRWTFTETIAGVPTTFYQLRAGRAVERRDDPRGRERGGVRDGLRDRGHADEPAVPHRAGDERSCAPTGASAPVHFGGGALRAATGSCRGFRSKSDLVPCDLQSPPAPTQFQLVDPYLDLELPFDAAGLPRDLTTNGAAYGSASYGVPDGVPDYLEAQDGSWATQSIDIAPSAKADGSTPIANSLIDIKGLADGTELVPDQRRAARGQARLGRRRRHGRRLRPARLLEAVERRPGRGHHHGRPRALADQPHPGPRRLPRRGSDLRLRPPEAEGEDDRPVRDGRRRHVPHPHRDEQRQTPTPAGRPTTPSGSTSASTRPTPPPPCRPT